jgi:hypothetical protein
MHHIEENHKVPKEKTTIGFGEIIYSKTNSAGYYRRENWCIEFESGNVEVQWNNIKRCVLDTLSDLVGKVE